MKVAYWPGCVSRGAGGGRGRRVGRVVLTDDVEVELDPLRAPLDLVVDALDLSEV
jgi:hypothetical protein